jgi:hypothetical protein
MLANQGPPGQISAAGGERERAFAPPSTSYFPGAGADAHPLTLWQERHNNGCVLDDRPRPPESKRDLPPANTAQTAWNGSGLPAIIDK